LTVKSDTKLLILIIFSLFDTPLWYATKCTIRY